jgi:hypothetical protein
MDNNRAIPIYRVISQIPDIFGAYDNVAINGSRSSPIISATDDEDGSRILIHSTNDNRYDIVIHISVPLDHEVIRASYALKFESDIIILKVNNDIIQPPITIARHDNITEYIVVNDNVNDDAMAIFRAHQDLFEELLYLD